MDVTVPRIPARYDPYRAELRQFITEHRPALTLKARVGIRTPEDPAAVEELRRWIGALHAAGYSLLDPGQTSRDPTESLIIEQELERTGLPSAVGNVLVHGAIESVGTPEQRERFLPGLYTGRQIWCQLFSEPDAGSDLASLRTRAERDGDTYVITGQKVWTTWGQWSDRGYLLARTDPTASRHAGITAFAVDMRQPGIDVRPLREITGSADFNEVFFDGATVPVADRLGDEGDGWKIANMSLSSERSGVASIGRLLFDQIRRLVELSGRPDAAGRRPGDDPGIRRDLIRFYERAHALRLLARQSASRQPTVADAPIQKLLFSEVHHDVAQYALRLLGPDAVLTEEDTRSVADGYWQDMYLYARAYTIAGGSSEIMRNILAERGLGMPREIRPV